jgi:hypothetical protein
MSGAVEPTGYRTRAHHWLPLLKPPTEGCPVEFVAAVLEIRRRTCRLATHVAAKVRPRRELEAPPRAKVPRRAAAARKSAEDVP